MSEDRKKIIAKLIKIKALAERGVGGEQATAQLMYLFIFLYLLFQLFPGWALSCFHNFRLYF